MFPLEAQNTFEVSVPSLEINRQWLPLTPFPPSLPREILHVSLLTTPYCRRAFRPKPRYSSLVFCSTDESKSTAEKWDY